MADFVFNISKGRVAEFYNRVDTDDPVNSALIIVAINANGASDDTMGDTNDLTALLATAANEVTNAGYSRKTLTQADLAAFAADDTNNRVDLDIADIAFGAISAGDLWTDLIICYDNDTAAGTDANIIPLTCHDFAVNPDGSSITAVIAAAGFFRAS